MKKHPLSYFIPTIILIIVFSFSFKNSNTLSSFLFDGLWHNCIGNATTNINNSGGDPVLEVSNIGDTGNDGLDMWINFTRGFGYRAELPDPNTLPHGAYVEWKYKQESSGIFTDFLVKKYEVLNNLGTPKIEVSYNVSSIGSTGLKFYVYDNESTLVYESTSSNDAQFALYSTAEIDVVEYIKGGSWSDRLFWLTPIVLVPPSGPEINLEAGAVILVDILSGIPSDNPITKIEMRTAQTNNYKVSVERIAMFEDAIFFHALGSTRPVGEQDGNLLKLQDMDGGGDDGIRVDLMEKILGVKEKVFEFEDYHIANINTNSGDAFLQLKTMGKLSVGDDEQQIGYVQMDCDSAILYKNISADFTPVGDDNPTYQIFNDGLLVTEANNVTSLTVQDWWSESAHKTKQPGLTKYSNIVRFSNDQNMVMNGTSYVGDEIRIIVEVGENIWLTKLDLLTDGISSLDITNAEVYIEEETDEVDPFVKIVGNDAPNHYNRIKRVGNFLYAAGVNGTPNSTNARGIFSQYDLSGNLIWTTQLDTPTIFLDFVETNDNGDAFLLVGRSEPVGTNGNWQDNESILCKIDNVGNIIHINHFQQEGREGMLNIIRHPNPVDPLNPFYISGIENVPSNSPSSFDYVTLFNVNENCAVNWKLQYAANGDNEFVTTLVPLASGGLGLFGKTISQNGYGLRIGGLGNITNDFEISDDNSPNTFLDIRDAIEVPNSTDFFIVGYLNNNQEAFIARIDENGNEIWSYDMGTQSRFDQIQLGPDGNLYVIGYGNVSGTPRFLVNQFNISGQLQWSRYIDDGETAYANGNLDMLSEGYIAYSDCRRDHPNGFGDFDMLIGVFDLDLSSGCTFDFPETVEESEFLSRNDIQTNSTTTPFTITNSTEGSSLTLECDNGCGDTSQTDMFLKLSGDTLANRPTKIKRIGNFLYVTGSVGSGTDIFGTFSQYDLSGNLNWTTRLDSASILFDFVPIDDLGTAFLVVGRTEPWTTGGSNWQDNESIVCQISSSGVINSVQIYPQQGRESFNHIVRIPNPAPPTNQPFYIIGTDNDQFNSPGSDEHTSVLNVNQFGQPNWRMRYRTNNADTELYKAAIALSNGDIALLGNYRTGAGQPYVGGVMIIAGTGSINANFGFSVDQFINAAAEATDGSGDLFIAGEDRATGQAFVARVTNTGTPLWAERSSNQSSFRAVKVGPDGNLYLLGRSRTNNFMEITKNYITRIIFDSNGTPSLDWTRYIDDGETAFSVGDFDVLTEGMIAYVDGRDNNPVGAGDYDVLLSLSSLEFNDSPCMLDTLETLTAYVLNTDVPNTTSALNIPNTLNSVQGTPLNYVCATPCGQTQMPCEITCGDDITVPNDLGLCTAEVILPMPTLTGDCSDWTLISAPLFTSFPVGCTTASWVYQSNSSGLQQVCSIQVCVEDVEAPMVSCNDFTVDVGNGPVTFSPQDIGSATDNCNIVSETIDINTFDCSMVNTTVQVTYTATDDSGLSAQCIANITIKDLVAPVITCPDDITVNCLVDFNDPNNTGGFATATDICDANLTITHVDNSTIGDPCNIEIERVWTAEDDCGNSVSCTQMINVVDDTAPVVTNCPADITVTIPIDPATNTCQWITVLPVPDVMDDCSNWILNFTLTNATVNSGTFTGTSIHFNEGTTNVVITAIDDCGNASDVCAYTATVICGPEFCPGNIIQNGDFEIGTPTGLDEDIDLAANWGPIWDTLNPIGGNFSTGDFYITSDLPVFPATQNQVAAFWCSSSGDVVQREGIMNELSTPLQNGNEDCELTFLLACPNQNTYFGTPRLTAYAVNSGFYTGQITNVSSNPLNVDLFLGVGGTVVELGFYDIPTSCDQTFTPVTINFNTSNIPLGVSLDHIFFTRADGISGGVYVAMDDVCLSKSDACCQDEMDFIDMLEAAVTVQVDQDICKATVNIGDLSECVEITMIDWGDGNISNGPFGSGSTPMHTYGGTGVYIINITAAEFSLDGDTCFTHIIERVADMDCPQDCECNGWQDLFFGFNGDIQFQKEVPVDCGDMDPIVLECPNKIKKFYFHGNFNCTDACGGDVDWEIIEDGSTTATSSGTVISSNSGAGNSYHFDINGIPYPPAGSYKLRLSSTCGSGSCACEVAFIMPECNPECVCENPILPPPPASIITAYHLSGCNNVLIPAFFLEDECDEITWRFRPDGQVSYTTIGVSQGNDPISYDFQATGFGTYQICMQVKRTLDDGTICEEEEERCQKVKIKCGDPTAACVNPLIDNSGFTQGTTPGILGNGGSTQGWEASFGAPEILDTEGCVDPYAIAISGNKVEADGLSTQIELMGAEQYGLEMCIIGTGELHENTRFIVRISDNPQDGLNCTGPCDTVARLSVCCPTDTIPYWITFPIDDISNEGTKYLTIHVENESELPEFKSKVILDGICLEPFEYIVTGTEELFSNNGINLYPNPTSGNLVAEFSKPTPERFDFRIYDLWGRVLKNGIVARGSSIHQLQMESFAEGVYIFEIGNTEQGFYRQKIIKHHP